MNEWPVNASGLSNTGNIGTGFGPSCAAKGRLHFARSPIDSPIYPTLDGTIDWCIDIMEENADRQGPFAIAIIAPSGPVSVVNIVD